MPLSPELQRMVSEAKAKYQACGAVNRVPHPAHFAKLSTEDQALSIEMIQRELDRLTEGLRSGDILPNHSGRGAALRNVRDRQKRLDKLAAKFGFRREWRKRVKVAGASVASAAATVTAARVATAVPTEDAAIAARRGEILRRQRRAQAELAM